ncbi:MAG: NUDIX domain-containing protein [Bacteroidales bacterium]|nr:NUDIX domain-containing protein [Bacteroidales bacterium]
MDKIYFDNRILFLSDKNTNKSENIYKLDSLAQLKQLILDFDSDLHKMESIEIVYADKLELIAAVKECFEQIPAAGGFVRNFDDNVLIMFRRGKWDLPKGKIDKGETPEDAALREVEEETGLDKLLIRKELGSTYHSYWIKGKHILKQTYWYEMKYVSRDISKLQPQIEEDIVEVKWMDASLKSIVFKNTYPSIIDVFEMVGF